MKIRKRERFRKSVQVTRVLGNTIIPGIQKLGQMNVGGTLGIEKSTTKVSPPFIDLDCMITVDNNQIIVSCTNQQ